MRPKKTCKKVCSATDEHMKHFQQAGIAAAKKAGDISLEQYLQHQQAYYKQVKGKKELFTIVDLACEQAIYNIIHHQFPTHNFYSEEGTKEDNNSLYTWIVDPLDSTKNYLHKSGAYSISIALAKRKDVILGIVYNPLTNELFSAMKGRGAYLNNKKLTIPKRSIAHQLIYVGGVPDNSPAFKAIIRQAGSITRSHSSAYDICSVATGEAQGFFKESKKGFGFPAACLIVSEAGGTVTDYEGNHFTIDSRKLIISDHQTHQAMQSIINNSRGVA